MGIALPLHAYTVQVSPATTHCDVTWTPQAPAPGDEVTVTLTPHDGYALEEYGFEVYYECTEDEWWEFNSSSANEGRFEAPRRAPAANSSNFEYRLEIWYLDANEDDPVEVEAGKTYTFVMPERNVEIEALCEGTDIEYNITAQQTDHGTTTVSASSAVRGATIVITATPDAGYAVDEVTASKYEVIGNAGYWTLLDVTKTDATHYSFVMPPYPVEVTVTYKESDLLLGDADGNGEVNNADAVAVLRHLVDNTPSNFVPANADVNQDGSIDNADAVLILRMLVE